MKYSSENTMAENQLSGRIIGTAIKIHKNLGPGLVGSAYKDCLYYELTQQGLITE